MRTSIFDIPESFFKVFACDRFHAYVYGRDLVHIETDYKPLEPIFTKPLATTPKCLKRMFLSL